MSSLNGKKEKCIKYRNGLFDGFQGMWSLKKCDGCQRKSANSNFNIKINLCPNAKLIIQICLVIVGRSMFQNSVLRVKKYSNLDCTVAAVHKIRSDVA